jgi:hypothetical protein
MHIRPVHIRTGVGGCNAEDGRKEKNVGGYISCALNVYKGVTRIFPVYVFPTDGVIVFPSTCIFPLTIPPFSMVRAERVDMPETFHVEPFFTVIRTP